MRPALHAGDLVINRITPAHAIASGDIVTFEDRRHQRNITHRVIERRETGGRIAFLTRGDANSGGESWSAARDEPLGRLVTSIPRAGFVMGAITSPWIRLVLTVVCAVALCTLALRWIWREG
jgi:signal peptidase